MLDQKESEANIVDGSKVGNDLEVALESSCSVHSHCLQPLLDLFNESWIIAEWLVTVVSNIPVN